jgi:uncharacterized membrane protein YdbT with pleckstrin-like domain
MTPSKREEVDAWWGSYSIKGILPSLLASLAASGALVGIAWLFDPNQGEQIILLAVLGACWLALLLNWINRLFGMNYRLTTRRLFVASGLRRRLIHTVNLAQISRIGVKITPVEKLLGLGRVLVEVQNLSASALILRAVSGPYQIAEKIRVLSDQAKQESEVGDQRSEIREERTEVRQW